ncbi:cell wall-binding repeat-containing protein [Euzebya sp.]|uniref:cell wall-binding repeat-containing protein n=1 Tax=Euzebya sp. TaxID=1971409 RepID=UPI0035153DF7
MAIAGCDFGSSGDTCEQIELHELSGPPPAATVPVSCRITHPDGHVYDAVALSPGGGGVAYAIRPPDSVVAQVVVHPDADVRSCDLDAPVVLGDTTTTLDWSPAPFDPAGGGGPPAPGGGPAPDAPVISLADGGRVDGGGAEDPVGQTIATSRSAWGDGEAELVVLATADRFPDALAGAALAGERGPILVTPFAEQLDARVAAEIARVTGGDGIALVLGGTSAVSEGAAAAAGEAAGATSCPAPYPTDCRYAGTGREDTAARIASTVLDRDGDLGVVLLARGDAFADAITGGAYAAEAGIPILLTPSTQLDAGTEAVIRDRGIEEVIILGGTAAVSDAVADALPATVRRVAGADRTETSAAIATELWQSEGLAGGGVLLVNVRDERGWPAARAAAGVSALANAPQLGVEDPPAPPGRAVLDAADALSGPVATYASTALVSDAQLAAVEAAR